MQIEDCFPIGKIGRAHGIKGEVRAFFDVVDLREYEKIKSVYLEQKGKLTFFNVGNFRIQSDREAILALKEILTRNEAELLTGAGLYISNEDVAESDLDQFTFEDTIGFTVVDSNLGKLGKITGMMEMPAQDLLQMDYLDQEILIPITDEFILEIEEEKQEIYTCLPEGLLDVFLNPDAPDEDDDED